VSAFLRGRGYHEQAVKRAIDELKPRVAHKEQIKKIVVRLGLDQDGDIAKQWIVLGNKFGRAHQRSHHEALTVDDEFRAEYQRPFDTVIRGVAVALEGRYVPLMRRAERLARMQNRTQAVAAFADEIPGALPLQRHFFESLKTGDWLSPLFEKGLLREPRLLPEEDGSGIRYRQWPAGGYLQRMAKSDDPATRHCVVKVLRDVASSKHPDIRDDGFKILASLPPNESAALVDVAIGWLGRDARYAILAIPEEFLSTLISGKQNEAALHVARALFQVWDDQEEVASLFGRHMYEYHLPRISSKLTKICGVPALQLLMGLLVQAGEISGRLKYDHHASLPITDDGMATHDIYHALVSAVRKSAEIIVADDPTQMRTVIAILTSHPAKTFARFALHVLAQNPGAAPELADVYLLNSEMIEQSYVRNEYAGLALRWFPSMSKEKQQAVLDAVDAMPDKYLKAWRAQFEDHRKTQPTPEIERAYRAQILRDALWGWRAVLSADRQAALAKTVVEFGDPDALRRDMFPIEQSPITGAELSSRPVSEIVAFLKTWRPEKDKKAQTVTALVQELRTAIGNDPQAYAANADRFVGLKPIYIRCLFEGLHSPTRNEANLDWEKVLGLIQFAYGQRNRPIDQATTEEGDDKDWFWTCKAATELLAAGLRRGATGIAFEHTAVVRALVFEARSVASKHPETEDFEEQFRRSAFFAAESTLRGLSVELFIWFMFWLSKDESSVVAVAPRDAIKNLPDIRQTLEAELADHSPDGRVPRAVMGRFLSWLFYFGEDWLKAQMPVLLPANDDLRRATWRGHLGHDTGPIRGLINELHDCYSEDIARLGDADQDFEFREFNKNRLADCIMILVLWGVMPEELLEQFFRDASDAVRQHAMWFVGNEVSRPLSEVPAEIKNRGLAYWERRLEEAEKSAEPDRFRRELGVIGQWCFHAVVDESWLRKQLLRMLRAGFVPTDALVVVEWLHGVAERDIDLAVEVLSPLLRHPRIDKWAHMVHRESVRAILSEGLSRGKPVTIERAHETIGFLASIGETDFLDLLPERAAE
jgi:hypothetical protein